MKIEEAITYAIMSDGHGKTTDPEVSPMKRGNRLPPEGAILGRGRSFQSDGRTLCCAGLCCDLPISLDLHQRRGENTCDAMKPSLQNYIESEILPRYEAFDAAHQRDHADTVIRQSLALAEHYDVKKDMVYAIAAYHDTGLVVDRKTHHLESGRIIREDARLLEWFTPEEIEVMAQAAEDHRASSDHEPRSIYGKIVAEGDRLIDTDTILRRTVQYGFAHYPEMSREEQIARAIAHLHEKYAEGGYLKLWIPESPNAGRLRELWALIRREDELLLRVENIYDEIKI